MQKGLLIGILGVIVGAGIGYATALQRGPSAETGHEMSGAMDAMTASLAGKEGVDFEHAFLMEMIVHHEGAVAMAQQVLEKSQRPELVQLANDIIAAQTEEIAQMRAWMDGWFGHAN